MMNETSKAVETAQTAKRGLQKYNVLSLHRCRVLKKCMGVLLFSLFSMASWAESFTADSIYTISTTSNNVTNYLSSNTSSAIENKTTADIFSLWKAESATNGFYLKNVATGLYLNASNYTIVLGTTATSVWHFNTTNNNRLMTTYNGGNRYLLMNTSWQLINGGNGTNASPIVTTSYTYHAEPFVYSGATTLNILNTGCTRNLTIASYPYYSSSTAKNIAGYFAIFSSDVQFTASVNDSLLTIISKANLTGAERTIYVYLVDTVSSPVDPLATISLRQDFLVATFNHQEGHSGRPLQANGMQGVHTEHIVYYLPSGGTRTFDLPETSFDYIRWYNYTEDAAIHYGTVDYTAGGYQTLLDGKGYYRLTRNVNTASIEYTYGQETEVRYLAADLSYYRDFLLSDDEDLLIEPTLSQRVIYEIHPASDMVSQLTQYDNTNGVITGKYLEEYKMIAPIGKVLRFGPKYKYISNSNYYYTSTQATNGGQWYRNGSPISSPTIQNDRVIVINESGVQDGDTVVYTLIANGYGIAKFSIVYKSQNVVGPQRDGLISLDELATNYKLLAALHFNRSDLIPLEWDESGYGFYYPDMGNSTDRALVENPQEDYYNEGIYWGEYAILNQVPLTEDYDFLARGTRDVTYQLTEGINTEGKFFYVDASSSPGVVASMYFREGNLCQGTHVYVSAWVNNLNVETDEYGSFYTLPNLNFDIIGINMDSTYDILETYTTGDLEAGSDTGVWKQILFEMDLPQKEYLDYRLRIVNNAQNASGNDFAIDQVGIYMEKPILMASELQPECSSTDDLSKIIIRLDPTTLAFPIENQMKIVYYQIQNALGDSLTNISYPDANGLLHGRLELPLANIPATMIYVGDENQTALEKYLAAREDYEAGSGTDPGYLICVSELVNGDYTNIFYLYQPLRLEVTEKMDLRCVIASNEADLSAQSECALISNFSLYGNGSVILDDEESGVSFDNLCASTLYTIKPQVYGTTSGGTERMEGTCMSDWLEGAPEDYGILYDTILMALNSLREVYLDVTNLNGVNPTTSLTQRYIEILDSLINENKLTLYSATIQRYPNSGINHYISIPIIGTGLALDGVSIIDICNKPIVFNLSAAEGDRLFNIGYESETDIPVDILNNRIVRLSAAEANMASIELPIRDTLQVIDISSCRIFLSSSTDVNIPSKEEKAYDYLDLNTINTENGGTQRLLSLNNRIDFTFNQGERYDFIIRRTNDEGCAAYAVFSIVVVPDYLAWNPQPNSYSWNNDSNWCRINALGETIDGKAYAPGPKSRVVIRKAETVPELEEVSGRVLEKGAQENILYDLNYLPNTCKCIHFDAYAGMAGHEYLTYDSAWVDMPLYKDVWNLISPPFEEMVVGDMHIPASGQYTAPLFTPVDTADNRGIYRIFTSIYNSTGKQKDRYGNETSVSEAEWTAPFNSVKTPIVTAHGYSLRVVAANDDRDTLIVRLPKCDTLYYYYGTYGERTNLFDEIERTPNGHRLASTNGDDLSMRANFNVFDPTHTHHLMSNPYLVELDMNEFFTHTENIATASGTYIIVSGVDRLSTEYNISLEINNLGEDISPYIPPMTSFLVELDKNNTEPNLLVHPSMVRRHNTTSTSSPAPKFGAFAKEQKQILRIQANRDGLSSSCVIVQMQKATNKWNQSEDSRMILVSESMTPGAVYTYGENELLSINSVKNIDMIPIGYASYDDNSGQNVILTFTGVDNFDTPLELYDALTQTAVKLREGIHLQVVGLDSENQRYYVRQADAPTQVEEPEESGDLMLYQPTTGKVVLNCSSVMLTVRVYSVTGQLVQERTEINSSVQEFSLPHGVYLFDVESESGVYRKKAIVR